MTDFSLTPPTWPDLHVPYNDYKDFFPDQILYVRLWFSTPLDPTTKTPPPQPGAILLWNALHPLPLKDLKIAVNLSKSGQGALLWQDSVRNHDPGQDDTKTFTIGTLPSQHIVFRYFEWHINYLPNFPVNNASFVEQLGLVPTYTVDYTGLQLDGANVQVNPNIPG